MKVLVTGATGFLGRHVVAALLRRGHGVRALVRPTADVDRLGWGDQVEVFQGDLRGGGELDGAFEGVDALVHLAAVVAGDEDARLRAALVGTERLLAAMARSDTRRVVLASSFAVYDWSKVAGTVTEEAPVEGRGVYERDSYALAKVWQERLVRCEAAARGWELTVLRPGAVWGDRNTFLPDVGQAVGRLHFVIGPMARLKLTYVENCAALFAAVVDDGRAVGRTFNVTDDHAVRNWRYTGEMLRRSGRGGWRVPVPYWVGLSVALAAKTVSRAIFGRGGKLPGLLTPRHFEARFKPVACAMDHARDTLGWRPELGYEQAVERCYGNF